MSRLVIRGGRVIDPSQGLDRRANLLVENGKIAAYDVEPGPTDHVLDAEGLIVSPGLVDMHVELREPGFEEDETIMSGTAAAIAGGYTSIACMPDTDPPIDTPAAVEFIRQKASRAGNCNVYVVAAASKNCDGKELAEIGSLVEAGAIAFSDGSKSIQNADLMRRALEYCIMFKRPILHHPEVYELSRGGVMHEGTISMVLGLAGIAPAAEDVMTSRDLRLADATGGTLHLMNISSSGAIDLIRRAKQRQIPVTAEIAPLHFTLTDECLRSFDSSYKLSPPLRSVKHVEACIAGLKDGTIDVIASSHQPRASEKKMQELDLAPFGAVGLETTLALVITKLIEPGHLSWSDAIAKLSTNPARVLGIKKGTLAIGADADITIIDPSVSWTVEPKTFHSKSANTPLAGMQLQGRAKHVIVNGQVKF
ncbi:dihydroorotase, multifunctional complex type [Pirellula staleyi DSM 6068]|uniref:Dihydroorotase n=1 Tax=Pirellula staleyi (strain ATCC 27377 / DSM 6068 / ICPB 4128) TaxID=530564 RepID=D2R642_PIRSD|nr:dihydroorotase [Pirellula staleyi]ADB19127.1 dihydroorotase, multifunctional complex type [Pirellula staleyi DSM 6068]